MRGRDLFLLASLGFALACAALGLSSSGAPAPAAQASEPSAAVQKGTAPARASSSAAPPASTSVSQSVCPLEMVPIASACMDRYEAHLLVERPDGSLMPHPAHERPVGGKFVAESRASVKPQAYISQVEAAAACENAGKRLCSLAEWYDACSGDGRRIYPYAKSFEKGQCNSGKPHLLSLLHGSSARDWSYAEFNDPELNQRQGFLGLTGEYSGCATPEGVYDMVGNLHEWVADLVDRTLATKLPVADVIRRRIGKTKGNGIFMGGFYSTTNEHGPGCTFITAAHEPGYHDYSTGFRCCRDR
jgi:formylglycine-generating enzyme required for sulfatase activity